MSAKDKWRPLVRATHIRPVTEADIAETLATYPGLDREEVKRELEHEVVAVEYWLNDLYQVAKRDLIGDDGEVGMVHLNIRRRDGRVIFRDWRHFQWIKNQLVGEECEGVEMYPAESRLNDTSNKYHLWVFTDPTYRLPFGMTRRDVIEDDRSKKPGHRQRRM